MKPFQKAILTIIIVIGMTELSPKVLKFFNSSNKVKVGDIWVCRLPLLVFENNSEVGEFTQTTFRKVIDIDGGQITYVISGDTTKYIMDVDEFTFNGKGMTNQKFSGAYDN